MKVLHYSLGIPPYRTGGLTKYSIDLMKEQISKNHQVFLFFPGHFSVDKRTKIKPSANYAGIKVFELINPLPVSLLGGVSIPDSFMKNVNPTNVYIEYLKNIQPDIIHIHTLMGIHKEFLLAAKELNIRILFSTHDYYGICPKVNLIDYKGELCNDNNNGKKCVTCNQNAFSLPLIYVMQSKIYRTFKENELVANIRKRKNKTIKEQNCKEILQSENVDSFLSIEFSNLRNYYLEIFRLVDHFHYNSENTKNEFEKYIEIKGTVLTISHNNILDNRKKKVYSENSPLKIGFLGSLDKYKGFPLLRESVSRLLIKGVTNWKLDVYGNNNELELQQSEKKQITYHGRYQHDELEDIFENTDVLIVPSIWKETFGFIGLEAISNGVPIIVSSTVGCKDIIRNGDTGIIFNPDSKELAQILQDLINDRKTLQRMNQNICNDEFPYTFEEHVKDMDHIYKKVIGVVA